MEDECGLRSCVMPENVGNVWGPGDLGHRY